MTQQDHICPPDVQDIQTTPHESHGYELITAVGYSPGRGAWHGVVFFPASCWGEECHFHMAHDYKDRRNLEDDLTTIAALVLAIGKANPPAKAFQFAAAFAFTMEEEG